MPSTHTREPKAGGTDQKVRVGAREGKMKQHITTKQLNELSEKGKKRLRKWWKPWAGDNFTITTHSIWVSKICLFEEDGYIFHWLEYSEKSLGNMRFIKEKVENTLPLLSIGQLIEFLDEHSGEDIANYSEKAVDVHTVGEPWHHWFTIHWDQGQELCDALWEAVKETLEK